MALFRDRGYGRAQLFSLASKGRTQNCVRTDYLEGCESAVTVKAIWNGVVVAESDDTVVVEGNHYFPVRSLVEEYFTPSETRSVCPWKGKASYYSVTVDGMSLPDAAWQYEHPSLLARKVKDRVAFWNGVQIVEEASACRGTGR
jgi:uncharacterized protein (DUF427 family)